MTEDRYSVILMRDDHTVRHFHFRPVWLRILLYSVLFLVAASILFAYAAFTFWHQNSRLKSTVKKQEGLLQKKDVRLNRLEKIESVIAFRDPDQLEKLITGQLTDIYNDSSHTADLHHFFNAVDTGRLSIDNFQVKVINKHTLALRFDLRNLQDDKPLRGKADVTLLTNRARTIEHGFGEDNQIFQIRHYKTFNASIHLPDGINTDALFSLRIIVSGPRGKVLFGKAYRMDALKP